MPPTPPARWPTERNRVLLFCGLFFWAGCGLAASLTGGLWPLALAGLSLPLGLALRRLGKSAVPALLLCVLALGVLRTIPCLHPAAPEPGSYDVIVGDVYGEPRLRADSRLTFSLANVELDGVPQRGRAYCSLYYGKNGLPDLFDGARVQMSGRVYLPEGKSGAPRFDFRAWMLRNGMGYGIAISKSVALLNDREHAPVQDGAYRLRERCRMSLERVMGDNARLPMAMLLNDKEGVSEQEYQAFRDLGIVHVLAVSGLHVWALGSALLWVLDKLRVRRGLRLGCLSALLLAYCAVTGFSAATLRASVMLLCDLLAKSWGRRNDRLTSWGTAMLAVLLIDPLQATSAGFVLSFSAVAGLMLLGGGFRRALDRLLPNRGPRSSPRGGLAGWAKGLPSRWASMGKDALASSLAAQLGVLLPTAMFFHSVPLYGVLINVPVIPYVALLVPVFAVTLLLSPVPLLGPLLGAVASFLSNVLWAALGLLSWLPYATLRTPSAPPLWVAGGLLALLALSRLVRARLWRKALAAGLCCAVAAGATALTRPPDTRYVQLAVGQGDAALLFAGDQTVAIDVGGDGSATLDYLMDTGRDLDALILTHLHLDHAGGVQALLDAGIGIRRAYLPINGEAQRLEEDSLAVLRLLGEAEIPMSYLAKGDELRYNNVVLRALWPEGDKVRRMQDANDLPLVLAIELGGFTLLNASDLTGRYERYAAVPCDVLKVAHHGSRDSTWDEFLSLTSPRVALISCSSGSRTLPGAETLQRLEQRGIPTLRTDRAGDITLWAENGRLMVAPYKRSIP